MSSVYIRLRDGRADRFEDMKAALEDEFGHPLTHTEVVSELMRESDIETEGRERATAQG